MRKKLCVGVKGERVNINSKTIFTGDNFKLVMDAVFWKVNFRNEVVWCQ